MRSSMNNGFKAVFIPFEVWDEYFDEEVGHGLFEFGDAFCNVKCSLVWQVISGDRGDDCVCELEVFDCCC